MRLVLDHIEQQLTSKGCRKDLLLQHLYDIQLTYSHIPPPTIDLLMEKLAVTRAEILAVIDFYAFLHMEPQGQFDIRFSDSITDHMLGSKVLLQQLCTKKVNMFPPKLRRS